MTETDNTAQERERFEAWWNARISPPDPSPFPKQFAWDGWQARAALVTYAIPPRWKLVPEDATDAMIDAADGVDWAGGDGDTAAVCHNIWYAMLAAAPQPPASSGADDAQIGRDCLHAIESVMRDDPAYTDWAPAENYGEFIADLHEDLELAREASGSSWKADAAWLDLVEKDDRTSPDDRPNMALITREELADYMASASSGKELTSSPDDDDLIPCDVHLPPNTYIRKGCGMGTLKLALAQRVGKPKDIVTFPRHMASAGAGKAQPVISGEVARAACATAPAHPDDFERGAEAMRKKCASAVRAWIIEQDDCDALGCMDPETGARECALKARGRDCICEAQVEAGEQIEGSIRSLPLPKKEG